MPEKGGHMAASEALRGSLRRNHRSQAGKSIVIGVANLGFVLVLYRSNQGYFARFLGNFNPVVAICLSMTLGVVLLLAIASNDRFGLCVAEKKHTAVVHIGRCLVLAVLIINFDHVRPLASDINIPFPVSVLFYPIMAFIVEVWFHFLPITILSWAGSFFTRWLSVRSVRRIILVSVACLEPIYHVAHMLSEPEPDIFSTIYIGVHILLFNLVQMDLFQQRGFIPTYMFRILYYAIWHVIWGHIRLKWLA